MKKSRRIVFLALFTGIISGIASSGLMALVHRGIDGKGNSPPSLILAFAGLCLLFPISRIVSELLLVHLSQKAVLDLRTQLTRQILSAPLRRLEEVGSHRLMSALTDDIVVIANGLTSIPILCLQVAVLVGCLAYLGWLSPVLLIGVALFILAGMASVQLAFNKGSRYMSLARKDQDSMFKYFRAVTDGVKNLKLHADRREAFFSELFAPAATSYQRQNVVGNAIFITASSVGTLLFFVLLGLILFASPRFLNIGPDVLVGFTLTLMFLMIPISVIGSMLPNLGRASVALKNVRSLGLSLADQNRDVKPLLKAPSARACQSLEFAGVTHTYHLEKENSSFTLGPIGLTLNAGEMVFIIGGNGSGKTTLAKLLTGLYTPESGEIRINGQVVNDDNREEYRQYFSALFTDFYLFDTLLGLNNHNIDEQARDYIDQLQLQHKVQIKDNTLSTIDLSQGQRKRLALLTAYLEDRPIYVFDEWAADQDPSFKEVFYYHILPELKARGKTVLVITHDDRYYQIADRIVKLDYGQIIYDQPVVHATAVGGDAGALTGSKAI